VGAYSAPPNPLAAFKGPTSKARGRDGIGQDGKGGEGKEGSQSHPPLKNPRSATVLAVCSGCIQLYKVLAMCGCSALDIPTLIIVILHVDLHR